MTAGISSATNASAYASTSTGTDKTSIASNFTQFLTLLTTQLKNQNPLDPMDTNQFTQQLVQFAGVEQQLKTNDRLDSILTNSKASASATAAGFIGKTVTADGTSTTLSEGSATWTLTPARAATKATITISDAKGNVVATKSTTLTVGKNAFTWDGKGASGMTQPDGTYSIKVDAQDATGSTIAVDTSVSGTVDSVDLSGSEPILSVGSSKLLLSTVKNLSSAGV